MAECKRKSCSELQVVVAWPGCCNNNNNDNNKHPSCFATEVKSLADWRFWS